LKGIVKRQDFQEQKQTCQQAGMGKKAGVKK